MATSARHTGEQAENRACEYLQQQGLTTLTRNYHCPRGELDIIMEDGETIVFVEVRFRNNNRFGSAAESITKTKQDKVMTTALYYLQAFPEYADRPIRFDVVAMDKQQTEIDWIKNAFTA